MYLILGCPHLNAYVHQEQDEIALLSVAFPGGRVYARVRVKAGTRYVPSVPDGDVASARGRASVQRSGWGGTPAATSVPIVG